MNNKEEEENLGFDDSRGEYCTAVYTLVLLGNSTRSTKEECCCFWWVSRE